jgi:hypothetical protein
MRMNRADAESMCKLQTCGGLLCVVRVGDGLMGLRNLLLYTCIL